MKKGSVNPSDKVMELALMVIIITFLLFFGHQFAQTAFSKADGCTIAASVFADLFEGLIELC